MYVKHLVHYLANSSIQQALGIIIIVIIIKMHEWWG